MKQIFIIVFTLGILYWTGFFESLRITEKPKASTPVFSNVVHGMPKLLTATSFPVSWPPKVGEAFPDLDLTTADGKKMKFRDIKGKIVIVGPVGMAYPGRHAFAGGEKEYPFNDHIVISDSSGAHPKYSHKDLIPAAARIHSEERKREPAGETTLSVKEAYDLIPHRQTIFVRGNSKLSPNMSQFYHRFFSLIDLAVVARVHYLKQLQAGRSISDNFQLYENIFYGLKALREENPEMIDLLTGAIREQKNYLATWNKSGATYPNKIGLDGEVASEVRSSSQKLRQAYSLLMSKHPEEEKTNKQAFFDHLCALDFI